MEKLNFRKASISDLADIEAIYERARSFMKETGNATQWSGGYPSKEIILSDIEKGHLFVAESDCIEAVFAFIDGEDPTYGYIEGAWLDDAPYCAVHRVASAGKRSGMLKIIMDYCFSACRNIKIDTHKDNAVMQKALTRYGFIPCGTIYLADGQSRIAFQLNKKD